MISFRVPGSNIRPVSGFFNTRMIYHSNTGKSFRILVTGTNRGCVDVAQTPSTSTIGISNRRRVGGE